MAMYKACAPYGACASCDSLRQGQPGPRPPEAPGVPEGPGPSPGEPPPMVCGEPGFPWLWVLLAFAVGHYWKD